MRETLQAIISLQAEYTAEATPAMKRRGVMIRATLPEEIRAFGTSLRNALGKYGDDADAQGKDNQGQMAEVPWVRWYSRSRSPSATRGWYVVYLFHPRGEGVSLCLSHGSTHIDGNNFVKRTDTEVAELMTWASTVVGGEFADESTVRQGVVLAGGDLASAYERTTVFSKFYAAGAIPPDAVLEADLVRFMGPLAKLYDAEERGVTPGAQSPDLLALRDEVERFITPLRNRANGQGRGLTGPLRKLVELHAMGHARDWLKDEGFDFDDVSANDSCDFRAKRNGEEWVIEVKGTTGGPGSVLLTRNEVLLHRANHPRNALLVVHGISLSEDRTRPQGGELIAISPWALEEERLSAVCYEYRLG